MLRIFLIFFGSLLVTGFLVGVGYWVRAALDCRKIETTEPELTEFNSREQK